MWASPYTAELPGTGTFFAEVPVPCPMARQATGHQLDPKTLPKIGPHDIATNSNKEN